MTKKMPKHGGKRNSRFLGKIVKHKIARHYKTIENGLFQPFSE